MRIVRTDEPGPYVIDRCPPSFIMRAPGNLSLLASEADPDRPRLFDTVERAESFLREELSAPQLASHTFRIIPSRDAKS